MSTAAAIARTDPAEDLPRGCTFLAPDWRILARHWHPVALSREVDAVGGRYKLLDQPNAC
jgi:vanillate O-demethylase monooxygenase subunit